MAIDYKSYEFQVYEYLIRLQHELQGGLFCQKSKEWLCRISDEQERIKTRRFCVAVVGEFKKGKSSFINALLGQEVLPVDASPATATLNRITYGTVPRAYLKYKDGSRCDVDIDKLSDYVTKLTEDSRKNAALISEAVVEYPSIFCQNYVDLIDTPGMNDDDSMNEAALSGLMGVDLVIAAISANYPFSETECNFMVKLLENHSISQIIVVVTHIDMIRERDRERLMSYIEQRIKEKVLERLRELYPENAPIFNKYKLIFSSLNLFGVSSVEALEARWAGDMDLLEKSGFSALNKSLPSLILSSQNNSTLKKAMDAVGSIVQECISEYPNMVSECRMMVEGMCELKHSFAGVGYERAGLLADDARVRMFECINQFGNLIKNENEDNLLECLSMTGSLSVEERYGKLTQQCTRAYRHTVERINQELDLKLEIIFGEAKKESMEQFCSGMRRLLEEFDGFFDRQQEELTRLFNDWTVSGLGESSIMFGWYDDPIPAQSRFLESEEIMTGIKRGVANSVEYYCAARKREISRICEEAGQDALKGFEDIVADLFARINQYEKRLTNAEEKLRSGNQPLMELEKISEENNSLQKKFQSEMIL